MLYVTTRDNKDACTAHKTLCANSASDGGWFIPYKLPHFENDQIEEMMRKPFGEVVAQILNLFFSAHLTGWDIELRIGRVPLSLQTMNRKIAIAELWNNPGAGIDHLIQELYCCIATSNEHSQEPTQWGKTAIRIAIIFGVFACLYDLDIGKDSVDIAVNTQDMTELVAAQYARAMGLPIGMIICCCDAGDVIWDLLQNGSMNTRSATKLQLAGAEQLISMILGQESVNAYLTAVDSVCNYSMREEELAMFSAGIYPAAIGPGRSDSVINSMLRSSGYAMDAAAAIAYGGLQDYRAQTGESRLTVILAQQAPSGN